MHVRVSTMADRLRSSLFFVPMAFVVGAIAFAALTIALDAELLENTADLPLGIASTVESARAVLSTVAGATITFAGIAFSISLLLIQQASSQYSPRVVQGLFRDPFNKRVMGVVVGTFTYCLVVLRSVRAPLESDGSPVIPNISVAFGVVFGLASILSIVAFISHSAHNMDVSTILQGVSEDARRQIRNVWHEAGDQKAASEIEQTAMAGDGLQVMLDRSGWIQHIDFDALAKAADPGGLVRAEVTVGHYAIPGTPLCTIVPTPHDEERSIERARRAIVTGAMRTAQQDVAYGIRQLADVALKALSPGINDPTTAQDALFHIGSVLRELLIREPPPRRRAMPEGRVLETGEDLAHANLVGLAFNEIRLAARELPQVSIYLLEVLHLVDESLHGHGAPEAKAALRAQASLVCESADHADLLPHDRDRIQDAYDHRFGEV